MPGRWIRRTKTSPGDWFWPRLTRRWLSTQRTWPGRWLEAVSIASHLAERTGSGAALRRAVRSFHLPSTNQSPNLTKRSTCVRSSCHKTPGAFVSRSSLDPAIYWASTDTSRPTTTESSPDFTGSRLTWSSPRAICVRCNRLKIAAPVRTAPSDRRPRQRM